MSLLEPPRLELSADQLTLLREHLGVAATNAADVAPNGKLSMSARRCRRVSCDQPGGRSAIRCRHSTCGFGRSPGRKG